MLILSDSIILNEGETRTLKAVVSELVKLNYGELNKVYGSETIKDLQTLESRFRYMDYYRRNHIIEARPLTEDEQMDDYYYRYEC